MCRYLLAQGTADDFIWEMLKTKEKTLIKAGVFNEELSEAENVIIPSTVSPQHLNRIFRNFITIYFLLLFKRVLLRQPMTK